MKNAFYWLRWPVSCFKHYSNCKKMKRNSIHNNGFTLLEIMIVVSLIALLIGIAIPSIVRARSTSQMNACISNLSQLDAAKTSWSTAMHASPGVVPGDTEIQPFLGRGTGGTLPYCPSDPTRNFDNSYNLQPINTLPTCRIQGTNATRPHVLTN